jgi:hypothetical protein
MVCGFSCRWWFDVIGVSLQIRSKIHTDDSDDLSSIMFYHVLSIPLFFSHFERFPAWGGPSCEAIARLWFIIGEANGVVMAMAGMVQDGPSCQDIGRSDQLGRIAIMSHPVLWLQRFGRPERLTSGHETSGRSVIHINVISCKYVVNMCKWSMLKCCLHLLSNSVQVPGDFLVL